MPCHRSIMFSMTHFCIFNIRIYNKTHYKSINNFNLKALTRPGLSCKTACLNEMGHSSWKQINSNNENSFSAQNLRYISICSSLKPQLIFFSKKDFNSYYLIVLIYGTCQIEQKELLHCSLYWGETLVLFIQTSVFKKHRVLTLPMLDVVELKLAVLWIRHWFPDVFATMIANWKQIL